MTYVHHCVVCDGEIEHLQQALVAPFLAQRIWTRSPFCVALVRCRACGFMFYNPRLDVAEENRLYAGYRSPEYQKMRNASEAWYTVSFNADLAASGYYEGRRRRLAAILSPHIRGRKIKHVLDYGGDRGDLVNGLINGAKAFVYDISSKFPVDGVVATADPIGCKADLVINSNVLEHVGYPCHFLAQMQRAVPAGSLMFLEVPCEFPFGLSRLVRRVAQIGITALMRPGLFTSVARRSSLFMMHEHVNYFSEQSLAALMRSGSCQVIATGNYIIAGRSGKGAMAWCLGTKEAG